MEKQGEKYDRYSYEELSAFCLQISLLLEAAVPLEEGLAIMAEDAASQGEKDMLLYMAEGVELGDPFFKVMEDTGVFPAYVVRMAKLGQQTGTMDQMMKSLSDYYEKEYRLLGHKECGHISCDDGGNAFGGPLCAVFQGHARVQQGI